MKVKKLTPDAILPNKAHAGDLGYDLYAAEQVTIWSGQTKLIGTGISVQFPQGYGGLIRDRSSVATKRNMFVIAGVIDNGYTGEIKIALHNLDDGYQTIYIGDKIAQLILIPTVDFAVEEVLDVQSLDGRGEKGFGSTGT
jgi:deoxyuridine 5'-triphosphate nucleotidohydrolase